MGIFMPLARRYSENGKLIGFLVGVISIYLVLAAMLILAQVERSIDRLSLSRTYLNGQRLTSLIAQASSNWLDLAEIPDLELRVEEVLLRDSEISAIVIRRSDGSVLASTGSQQLISLINDEWGKTARRHFALQGANQPFVKRAAGFEFCAIEAHNISGEMVATIWLARKRETARRTIETAFSAIADVALVFALPVIFLASMSCWLGLRWYAIDTQKSAEALLPLAPQEINNVHGDHLCEQEN